jgi:hypothetical protein
VVSWFSRYWDWVRGAAKVESAAHDQDVTAEYATDSSLPLMPGVLKLRVGVVSTVGNYREHNEDNFFVPGRLSVVDGGSSDSTGEMPAYVLEPTHAFLVADGLGGQQAGEVASRMAV